MRLKGSRDRAVGQLTATVQQMERDKVAYKEMKVKVSKVDEWRDKWTSSEKKVVVLRAELQQVREELAMKEGDLTKMSTDMSKTSSNLAKVTAESLHRPEEVLNFFISEGIKKVVDKIFSSDEFGKMMSEIVPKVPTTGLVRLLEELQPLYFKDKDLKDLPGFAEGAKNISNAAFTKLQWPKLFQIVTDLTANPSMTVEEIRALKTPILIKRNGGK